MEREVSCHGGESWFSHGGREIPQRLSPGARGFRNDADERFSREWVWAAIVFYAATFVTASFRLKVVKRTVGKEKSPATKGKVHLRRETIQHYDELKRELQNIVDMPDKDINLMIMFLHQNKGVFPNRRRKDFTKLTNEEIADMEVAYKDIFYNADH